MVPSFDKRLNKLTRKNNACFDELRDDAICPLRPEMYLERPPDPGLVDGHPRPKTWGEANVVMGEMQTGHVQRG